MDEKKSGSNTALDQNDLMSKLQKIEKNLDQAAQTKKNQTLVSIVGVVCVVIVLILFVKDLTALPKKVKEDEVVKLLKKKVVNYINTDENKQFLSELKASFVPLFKDSLFQAFKAKMPQIRASANQVSDNLKKYIMEDFKAKFEKKIFNALSPIEDEMQKKFSDLSKEEIHSVVEAAKEEFVKKVTADLVAKVDTGLAELQKVRNDIEKIKTSDQFKSLKGNKVDMVQAKMMESILELWIYKINPVKGNTVGGAK